MQTCLISNIDKFQFVEKNLNFGLQTSHRTIKLHCITWCLLSCNRALCQQGVYIGYNFHKNYQKTMTSAGIFNVILLDAPWKVSGEGTI